MQAAARRAIDADRALREELINDPVISTHLSIHDVDALLLDPGNYTGSAGAMVDAVLALLDQG